MPPSDMEVFFRNLGNRLVQHARGADNEILLAAPFIKREVLSRILSPVQDGFSVHVITRWKDREIAAGVSDLEVWEILRNRRSAILELLPSLHAKYYRFDDIVLAGSANLTEAALGWGQSSNLEFLNRFSAEKATTFEKELGNGSRVTNEVYREHRKRVEEYDGPPVSMTDVDTADPVTVEGVTQVSEDKRGEATEDKTEWWIPRLQQPEHLYWVYSGNTEHVPQGVESRCRRDLHYLELTYGLDKQDFESQVREQLLREPVVESIDRVIKTTKPFRLIQDHLRSLPCAENENFDAEESWQALLAWLLYFTEDRYEQPLQNHIHRCRT